MPMFSVQHMSLFPFFFSYLYPIPPPQNPEFECFLVVSMHIVLKKKMEKDKRYGSSYCGTKILQKCKKIIHILPKPFDLHS